MLTSKQRAKLRSLASTEPTIFRIGKGAVSDNMIQGLDAALTARELIKIAVLKNCDYDSDDLLRLLEMKLRAEAVFHIGAKILMYRYSHKEGIKHIEL